MAGAAQHHSRGSIIRTPSASSDDGTLADTPLADISMSEEVGVQQHAPSSHSGPPQDHAPVHYEIAPLSANVIEALKVVSKLEKLGLDRQEISLPKCVVLGDQSTGKSSVIEVISGIRTPPDTGTCTRCPLFIELQPAADASSPWRAEIQLLRLYDLATDLRHRGKDTKFPGWVPAAVPGKTAFVQVNDPAELETYIRCAQRATLSPLEDPHSFLDPSFDDQDIHRTLFSPNIVCITVSKPGLPPLSFFDLPGMIGQAETEEEEYTVPLIKALVTEYILDEEAFVIVTCALENDVHNSTAAGLAGDLNVKPRCLGVLTKPDRLPQGSSAQNLACILEGRKFAMGHGYFVVKNLNSHEIHQGLTHMDARRLEQEFFASVLPWATELQPYQPRFGTINLQRYLSTQLGDRVMQKLPVIREQIEKRLEAVEAELSRIPDTTPHTAVRTVADVVQDFCVEVRSEMAGNYGHVSWKNAWKGCQRDLWDKLLKLKPTMSTTGDLDKGLYTSMLPGQTADEAMVIDSDDEVEPETPSKKRKHDTPTKRESQTPVPSTSPFRTPRKPAAKPSRALFQRSSSSNQASDISKLRKPFKLDDITRDLSLASRSRVPSHIDPQLREEMMVAPFENWPLIINGFFDDFEQRLKLRLQELFDRHFREWKGSELHTASHAIVHSVLDNNLHEQRTTMAAESLNDELEGPHIFHEDKFKDEKAAVMDLYAQARFNARLRLYYAEYAEQNDQEMPPAKKEQFRKDERKMALIKREPYSREIDLVADISTYYMIAARRFHDSVTMRIESKFFKQLRDKLPDQLQDELGIYDTEQGPYNAQRLLAKSPERLERRDILVAQKKQLMDGLQCFHAHVQKFQAQNGSAPVPPPQSNYQHPSVSALQDGEMVGSPAHNLPLRSMSRPAV